MVNIQSPTTEIRRGKKKKEERRNRMKIYMVSLFHRATIIIDTKWISNKINVTVIQQGVKPVEYLTY